MSVKLLKFLSFINFYLIFYYMFINCKLLQCCVGPLHEFPLEADYTECLIKIALFTFKTN